jgi:hypothetical protein
MNMTLTYAVAFAALTAAAVYQAVDAFRWHSRRRFWLALAAVLPLATITCGAMWIGIEYPTFNFWGNIGFGSDWECSISGRASAQVCFRDLPARLQTTPIAPASAP